MAVISNRLSLEGVDIGLIDVLEQPSNTVDNCAVRVVDNRAFCSVNRNRLGARLKFRVPVGENSAKICRALVNDINGSYSKTWNTSAGDFGKGLKLTVTRTSDGRKWLNDYTVICFQKMEPAGQLIYNADSTDNNFEDVEVEVLQPSKENTVIC